MVKDEFTEWYSVGYNAAFTDLDKAIKSVFHKDHCGQCRACLFLDRIMNYVVKHVSEHMTKEEELTVLNIFSRCFDRLQEEQRREQLDWWEL